jgi:glucose/arabinose dehydrogenase
VNVANSTPANPYAIPAGNPFAGATPGNDEIWAYGVRNPFRNSFDRVTGDFWIGDVGQDTREEIDFEAAPGVAGRNYGWRAREGFADNPGVGDAAASNAQDPIFDYANPPTASAAITGGYVYRGSDIPDLVGTYFFADYEMSKTFSLKYNGSAVTDFMDRTTELFNPFGANNIASVGEDYRGELYMLDLNGGEMFKIVPEPSALSSLLLITILFRRRLRPLAASRTRDTMHR